MTDLVQPIVQRGFPLAQRSVAAASISSSYAVVGSVFASAPVLLIIVSTLNQTVQFSWDGIVDAFPIPAGGTMVLDFKSDGITLSANYGPYVKEIGDPTTGSLYIGGFAT